MFDVEDVKLWWKYDGGSLKENLKFFRNDGDATELSGFAKKK